MAVHHAPGQGCLQSWTSSGMISAAAWVTVSARLSGRAWVATSLVNTSVTTKPNPQAPWLGCQDRQDLPGHVASQGCLGPGRGDKADPRRAGRRASW